MLYAFLLISILTGPCVFGNGSFRPIFMCTYGEEEYLQGERMYITEDACLYCECSPTWRGIDDCSFEQCEPLQQYEGRHCIQIYYPGVCCPEFQCPDETLSGRRRRELFDVVQFTTPTPPTSIPTCTLSPGDEVTISENGTNTLNVSPLPVSNGWVLHIEAAHDSSTCYRYIQLQFFGFDLSSFHPDADCTRQTNEYADILQSHLPEEDSSIPYFDIVDGGLEMKAWRICGMKEGSIFTSLTDTAYILFRPGTYTIPPFTIKATLRNDCCGGAIILSYDDPPFTGHNIITSPNYPQNYIKNDHCTYTIKVKDSSYKPLCTVFDLTVCPFEDCFDEQHDVLKDTLFVGDSNTILDGETWCGQVSPFAVMSAAGENEIQVHWRTKTTAPNRGFYMTCMATDRNGISKYEKESSCNCGMDTTSSGGTQFPFLVKIENSGSGVSECTGVLISDSFVLTLGQCVSESYKNEPLFETKLTLGIDDPGGHVTIAPHQIIGIHFPEECGSNLDECVSLVHIPRVSFSQYLLPVCLPLFEMLERSGKDVHASAFKTGGFTPRSVTQYVYDPRFCELIFGSFPRRLFCTSAEVQTSLCRGEKGAPLLVWEDPSELRPKQQNIFPTVSPHWVLHGINMVPTCEKFNSAKYGPMHADVYIRVSSYLYWITDLLSKAESNICARPTE